MSLFWIQSGYSGREALKVMDWASKLGHQVKWGKNPPKNVIPIGDVEFCEQFYERKTPDFTPLWLSEYFHRNIEFAYVEPFDQTWECLVLDSNEDLDTLPDFVNCEMHDLTDPTKSVEFWEVDYDAFMKWPCDGFKPQEGLIFYWNVNIKEGLNRLTLNCKNYRPKDVFVKSAEFYKAWPAKIVKKGEKLPDGKLLISDVVEFVQEWRYYVANGEVLATGWYDGSDEDEPAPDLNIKWPKHFCGAVDFGRLSTGEIALVESQHPYACGWYGDDHKAYIEWLIKGWEYMQIPEYR